MRKKEKTGKGRVMDDRRERCEYEAADKVGEKIVKGVRETRQHKEAEPVKKEVKISRRRNKMESAASGNMREESWGPYVHH